jgi:hypothetical protein
MKDKLEQAKNYTSEKLSNIKSAYEEHGGGIKGIAAATMEAIKTKYQVGFDAVNTLTGGKLGTLADTMKNKMDEAKQRVHDAIESIKSFFNFNISWPHISMPSISVSWSTDGTLAKAAQFLGLPGLPSFSINWNALGAIFDDPTLIGWAGGKLQGVGEAGPEAVTPIETLRQYIGDAIDERLAASERNASELDWLKEKLDMIEERIEASGNIFLDGDKVSNKIAPYSDSVSGVRNELADRGVLV